MNHYVHYFFVIVTKQSSSVKLETLTLYPISDLSLNFVPPAKNTALGVNCFEPVHKAEDGSTFPPFP